MDYPLLRDDLLTLTPDRSIPLPLEADYWAAQEKAKSSDAKNNQMTIIK